VSKQQLSVIVPCYVNAGLFLSTMAQVYPEDRGTDYAIREGRRVGVQLGDSLLRAQADAPAAL